ncbi:hypothetical protein QAD02_001900 [Eretmocerus hayati]|uniref:Uncharacterized protein n=1 Tax=Eretmocerus hayati TaxID=131215 RepID=A0ACC2NHR4_9HYME|nr:hypothetical protein QAD02_001900 [Eretmocerus hayati]
MTFEGSSQPKRLEIRRQIEEASREEIETILTTDALIRERIRELNKTLGKLPNNNERLPLLGARRLALIGALEFHRDNLQYATSPSPLEIEAAESNNLLRTSGVHNIDTYGLDSEEEYGPPSPAPSNASLKPTASTIQQAPLTSPSEPETSDNEARTTSKAATQTDAAQTSATVTGLKEPTSTATETDISATATSTE